MSNDKSANLSQLEKFKQAARDLGTDDDPEHFKQVVRRIAKAPAKKSEPKSKPSGK